MHLGYLSSFKILELIKIIKTPIKVRKIEITRAEVIALNFKNFGKKSPVILKIKY